jgi:hypothetical protein
VIFVASDILVASDMRPVEYVLTVPLLVRKLWLRKGFLLGEMEPDPDICFSFMIVGCEWMPP